jgi:hypothetical protein
MMWMVMGGEVVCERGRRRRGRRRRRRKEDGMK